MATPLPLLTPADADAVLKPVLLKDLRIQCRARGLTPAGGAEALRERLKEHMLATGDFNLRDEKGNIIVPEEVKQKTHVSNNYARPEGQNVGNYITDRSSSRVLAPPGGHSQISFGDYQPPSYAPPPAAAAPAPAPPMPAAPAPAAPEAPPMVSAPAPAAPAAPAFNAHRETMNDPHFSNNYSRPAGQNVGNFLSGRNTSRVLAPPGGASQISFG